MTMKMHPMEFPEIRQSSSQRLFDLRFLAYRNGASLDCVAFRFRTFDQAKSKGLLGQFLPHRLPLLLKLYETMKRGVASGDASPTTYSRLRAAFKFYEWADDEQRRVDLSTAADSFLDWCEHVHQRTLKGSEMRISLNSAHSLVGRLDTILVRALGFNRSLLAATSLSKRPPRQTFLADRQDMRSLEIFGRSLVAICDSLTPELTLGRLPVVVRVGDSGSISHWCGLLPPENVAAQSMPANSYKKAESDRARLAWELDPNPLKRLTVFNMRIRAEMLIFIAQTSMNLAQAQALKREKLRSYVEGEMVAYVRAYKGRRRGEVVFRAFRSYRTHFSRYLDWLDACFPDRQELLFPIVGLQKRTTWKSQGFQKLKEELLGIGVPFFGPMILRRVKANWLAERIGNRSVSVEAIQHLESTNAAYQRPNLSRAMGEISEFNRMIEQALDSAGPGQCTVPFQPWQMQTSAANAPIPDCVNPAGCLFCVNHQDIESLDYMWSLASYRALKVLEVANHRNAPFPSSVPPSEDRPPAVQAADQASKKLIELSAVSLVAAGWAKEAEERVREGNFHPKWAGFIRLMELG